MFELTDREITPIRTCVFVDILNVRQHCQQIMAIRNVLGTIQGLGRSRWKLRNGGFGRLRWQNWNVFYRKMIRIMTSEQKNQNVIWRHEWCHVSHVVVMWLIHGSDFGFLNFRDFDAILTEIAFFSGILLSLHSIGFKSFMKQTIWITRVMHKNYRSIVHFANKIDFHI